MGTFHQEIQGKLHEEVYVTHLEVAVGQIARSLWTRGVSSTYET